MKYSDRIAEWLLELGYATCFFVDGGGARNWPEAS